MVHGPCVLMNPNAQCLQNGVKNFKCDKGYPKSYEAATIVSENGRINTRRRSVPQGGHVVEGIKVQGMSELVTLDNKWCIEYNPWLLLKYKCHINVQIGFY